MAKQPEAMRMMGRGEGKDDETPHMEDTPAYAALMSGGLINNSYRRTNVEDIFTGSDLRANSSKDNDLKVRCMYCYYTPPFCGACLYNCTHTELFVPAGFVGLLMNESNEYLFAQPGMHNISSVFLRVASEPVKLRGHIKHGNRTITIIEQGYVGYAQDNGQPVLLPPGIHVWTSESMDFLMAYPLNDHIVRLGPYTLITVDEGYAAVTQNNGKQAVLKGGHTHLLNHKNWKFEKFMTLKIQTDDLEKIQATSADNINMMVNSTVNWRIVDVEIAATMAAETMAISGRVEDVTADISKLRRDVLKQALASLAAFIGGVNYSESFHMSAAAQNKPKPPPMAEATLVDGAPPADAGPVSKGFADNPLYDIDKMGSAVAHANRVTQTYGIEVMSINIISAYPCDAALTKSLASGAVASAEALQAETAARGQANAVKIQAEAEATRCKIEAQSRADADVIQANGKANAERIEAEAARDAERLRAEGVANGMTTISEAMQAPGGDRAMAQRLAEQYVGELAAMAKNSNMLIVPDKPNDITGVLATAMSLGKTVTADAQGAGTARFS